MTEEAHYSLLSALKNVKDKEKPPIHLWHPTEVKDIDMEIKRNGDWYYEGSLITRQRLARLFASVLKLDEDGDYYLITPVEKCRIRVEDKPFLAILMDVEGSGEEQRLRFTTNMGDEVEAGKNNALRIEIDPDTEEPSPYLQLGDGLEARLNRNVYYQLLGLVVEKKVDKEDWFGVWSAKVFLPLFQS